MEDTFSLQFHGTSKTKLKCTKPQQIYGSSFGVKIVIHCSVLFDINCASKHSACQCFLKCILIFNKPLCHLS